MGRWEEGKGRLGSREGRGGRAWKEKWVEDEESMVVKSPFKWKEGRER